ncbi:MAG: YhcB family protein [Proteobacteria bacterium]|nr:YhcB family protein [Pseudomonadota bacterium]
MKILPAFILGFLVGLILGFMTTNLMGAYARGQQDLKAQIKSVLQSTGQLPITIDEKQFILKPQK